MAHASIRDIQPLAPNDRPNINAHKYKVRYGLPLYTMIIMDAIVGGLTTTTRPNPININKTKYFAITSTKQINASNLW